MALEVLVIGTLALLGFSCLFISKLLMGMCDDEVVCTCPDACHSESEGPIQGTPPPAYSGPD